VAIWRNLITATLSFEGPFAVAVFVAEDASGTWDVARDHFGLYTPVARHGSVRAVIEAVRRQEATVGVLPLPRQDDADPWWRHLITHHPDTPKIIARLPFAGPTNARDGNQEALVICPVAVVPTSRDRTFLGGDSESELSIGQFCQALRQENLTPLFSAWWQETGPPHPTLFLAEVEGFVGAEDPRLDAVRTRLGSTLKRLIWLGGYAVPLTTTDLGPAPPLVAAFPARNDGVAPTP
jgi:hypothetical protein